MLCDLPEADNDQIYFNVKEKANVASLEGNVLQKMQRHGENFDAAVKLVEEARLYQGRVEVNEAPFQRLIDSVFSQWREYTYNKLVATSPRDLVVPLILDSETRKAKDKIDWLSR